MSTGPNKKVEEVYVELDVLLDTRLGTIARLSDDAAFKTLENGYHTRDTDLFEFVDMDEYRKLYAQRDSLTLSKSMCSGAIAFLKHLAGVLTEQAIARPYHDGVKIVVNLHPYADLTTEETDQIGKAIAAWMPSSVPIELVSIPPERLTPSFCKSNFAAMLVYEYEAWMNIHAQAFESVRLPEVSMYVPQLYAVKPTAEELEKELKEAAHPFRAIEYMASPLIGLTLIDVKYFSIIKS